MREVTIKQEGLRSRMASTAALSISQLRSEFDGRVIAPSDAEYDKARMVFSGVVDRRPAVIVRPVDVGEVSRLIRLARETGLELAVRSGGHSGAGHGTSEGGIVLDLSQMRAIDIDVGGRTAWAETGLTAGEYSTAVAAHGLATGFGDTASVGIGGITLGGGVGYLSRKHGLTVDALLAAEIVTADGELVHTDEKTEPDLFWAIRGGGGNFGVATRFKYRLFEVPQIVGGMLMLPATAETIAGFIAAAEAAAEELSTIANVMPAPPMPFVPEDQHGKLVIIAFLCYAGAVDAGQQAMAPFRALGQPIVDMVRPMSYPEIYPPVDESYRPVSAARTMFIDQVDGAVAETILDHLQASTGMMSAAQLRVLGGAVGRVPADATAYAHRQSRIMVNLAALYQNPNEAAEHEKWVAEFGSALQQSDAGAYVNFLGDESEARVRAAYPGDTWERLSVIKRRYDPFNVFRVNQNIPPAASAG